MSSKAARENKYFESFRARVLGRYGKAYTSKTPAEWIAANTMLRGRPFSFKDHEYQIRPLNDLCKRVASHKPAQVGWTEIFIRWMLYYCVNYQGFTVIFTQPTKPMVEDFSKGRVKDAILQCEQAQKLVVSGDLDSASVKRIGLSYMYFKGTIGKSSAISVPADALIHDETNFSAPNTMDKFKSRIQHSSWGFIRNISTPTIPSFGVSAMFEDSDKKHILWKCTHCNEWFKLTWPKSIWFNFNGVWYPGDETVIGHNSQAVDYAKELRKAGVDVEAAYRCPKCECELEKGDNWEWVAERPGHDQLIGGVSGYSMSQMDVRWVQPWDIVCASDPELKGYKSLSDFYNFVLGEPHLDAKDGVLPSDFDELHVSNEPILHGVGAFIGIDMGKTCHCTVILPSISAVEADTIAHCFSFDADDLDSTVDRLVENYKPLSIVLDSMPYELSVNKVIKRYPEICHKARYKGDKPRYDQDVNEIRTPRTPAIDLVVSKIRGRQYSYFGPIAEVKNHFNNIARVQDEDEYGNISFSWINLGADHYVHSHVYAELAREVYEMKTRESDSHVVMPSITGMRVAL